MNFNTIQQPLIEALGWTLLHSLWQGLIIAALLAISIRFIKNKSPKLTYQLCCLSLLGLFVWMASTFIHHFHWPIELNNTIVELNPTISGEAFSFFASNLSWQQNIDIFFQSFIQSYADELVMLWLLGVSVFGLKWIGTLYFTYTLKRNNFGTAPEAWNNMVQQFSQKLGIKKAITIVQSTKVDVPMVIGYLKPVILMPASMATGFSSEQIETIIVHELAHIKSNDFLIGLILSAMEVVLFYHPMYWWVSGIISEEREKCCDDIAVAQCGNPLLYARTLFSIAEQKQQRSLALSLQGKKNQLFDRIKRVCITPQGKPSNSNNKAGMALGFLFVIAIMALAQVPTQAKEAVFEPVKEALIEQFTPETTEESSEIETATIEDTEVEESLVEENSDLVEADDFETSNNEFAVSSDTIIPHHSNQVILLTKLDEDGNIYITKKDTDGQGYTYIIKKNQGKIYIDGAELKPGNHRLSLTPETEIQFIGTTLILDRDDIDLDNLDKVFDGDTNASDQYYAEAKEQLEADFTGTVRMNNSENREYEIEEEDDRSWEEVGEELKQERIERQREAMEKHEEAMEHQREDIERQREAMEQQHEKMERQREEIERQREEMEEKRADMERKREELQERIERQREEMEEKHEELKERMEEQREAHRERMELHREEMEAANDRREVENDLRQEHNDRFHALLSEELYKDGLTKKKTKYKFKLSLYELKVNKKKVSDELHQKYLELYEQHYNKVMKENSNVVIQRS